jgi:hypothetical protein
MMIQQQHATPARSAGELHGFAVVLYLDLGVVLLLGRLMDFLLPCIPFLFVLFWRCLLFSLAWNQFEVVIAVVPYCVTRYAAEVVVLTWSPLTYITITVAFIGLG